MLKKLSRFLLLCTAGISLTFGFVACSDGDDGNTTDNNNSQNEQQGESGNGNSGTVVTSDTTYTYTDPDIGELTILAKTDGSFTASIQGFTLFAGTYSLSGSTITVTLTQEVNETGTLVAVEEEETLVFTVGTNNVLTLSTSGSGESGSGESGSGESGSGESGSGESGSGESGSGESGSGESGSGESGSGESGNGESDGLVNYKVYHSFENLEGEYVVDESLTETLTGYVGYNTEAQAKEVTGFVAPAYIEQVEVGTNTSITIKYTRITYTIAFDCGIYDTVDDITGKYGATVTAPTDPTRTGYTFTGWSPALPETFTENLDVTAQWEAKTVDYKVYHSFENLDGEYVVNETLTETLQGKVDTKTAAVAKEVTGFITPTSITQKTIGTETSVTIEYARKTITITFDSDNGGPISSRSGKYGATVTAPTDPIKANYTFKGWSPALPETFESDLEVTAQWEREKGDVSVTIY